MPGSDDTTVDDGNPPSEKEKDDQVSLDKELQAKLKEGGWSDRISPLTTTLMAGVLTIAGSVVATFLQGQNTLQLERQKFESNKKIETQKQEHELILKMASVGDLEQAKKNVRYLAEVGLITDADLAAKILKNSGAPVLPPPPGTAVPAKSAPGTISPATVELITAFEVSGRSSYDQHFSHPYWAGGNSGLTIGIGYDLGYVTADVLRDDWAGVLTAPDIQRLASLIGIRAQDAKDKLASVQDISIQFTDAQAVLSKQLARYAKTLDTLLPNARELPPDCYGAIVSLVYNRGPSFTAEGDRYTEMRNIKDLMEKRDFASIPAQIRSMKRLYTDRFAVNLQKRRELEAKLFEQGLTPPEQRTVSASDHN
jgi:GH24 family phage-related lysozyme (muramidase)